MYSNRINFIFFLFKTIVAIAFLGLSCVSMAESSIAPFQLAADTAYRGLQALNMKKNGIAEVKVRANVLRELETKAKADLISTIIADSLPNFVDNIYPSTEIDARKMAHKLIEHLTSLTSKQYGEPQSAAEKNYAKCLKEHGVRYQFARSLENQMQSTLNKNHSSVAPRAHVAYLATYLSAVEQSSQVNSESILKEYSSCFKKVAVN